MEYFNINEIEKENLKKNIKSKFDLILEKKTKLEVWRICLEKFPSFESPKLQILIISRLTESKFILNMEEKHFAEKLEKLF